VRRAISALAARIPEGSNGFHRRRRAREFLSTAGSTWQDAYAEWVTYFSPGMRRALYCDDFRRSMGDYNGGDFLRRWFARVAHATPLDQASYVDLHTFLPHNLLAYGDRMSMAHALELRLPFTDHKLVEFAMRLPARLKLHGNRTKHLLRAAMRPLLPGQILERGKLGLNPPLGLWLKGELAPLVDRYLSTPTIAQRGWFRPAAVAELASDFRAGRRDFSLHLWSLLVLEEWCRQYLDGQPAWQSVEQAVGAAR
jgi:asparagine synthase (glutamine-hydrolysing)